MKVLPVRKMRMNNGSDYFVWYPIALEKNDYWGKLFNYSNETFGKCNRKGRNQNRWFSSVGGPYGMFFFQKEEDRLMLVMRFINE